MTSLLILLFASFTSGKLYNGPEPDFIIDRLIPILAKFESNDDPNKISEDKQAVGILQIKQERVSLVNSFMSTFQKLYNEKKEIYDNTRNYRRDQTPPTKAYQNTRTGELHYFQKWDQINHDPDLYLSDFDKWLLKQKPYSPDDRFNIKLSKDLCKIYLMIVSELIDGQAIYNFREPFYLEKRIRARFSKRELIKIKLLQIDCDSRYAEQLARIWKGGLDGPKQKDTARYGKKARVKFRASLSRFLHSRKKTKTK